MLRFLSSAFHRVALATNDNSFGALLRDETEGLGFIQPALGHLFPYPRAARWSVQKKGLLTDNGHLHKEQPGVICFSSLAVLPDERHWARLGGHSDLLLSPRGAGNFSCVQAVPAGCLLN